MLSDPGRLAASTPEEFASAIDFLYAALGRPMPDDRVLVAYRAVLARLTADQLRGAVQRFLASGDDWPTGPKLLKLAGAAGDDRAMRELLRIRAAVARGDDADEVFKDPLVASVIGDVGGPVRFHLGATCTPEFEKRWREAFALRLRLGSTAPALPSPRENHEPPPRRIVERSDRQRGGEPARLGTVLESFATPAGGAR